MKIKGHWIVNPFFMYCISWTVVIIVYNLGWSEWFPKLSNNLFLFLFLSVFLSGVIGFFFQNKSYFFYRPIKITNKKTIRRSLIVLYFLLIVEFFAARSIPLLGYITGNIVVQYVDFGLPIIHVIVVNGFSFLFLYLFHAYISNKDKSNTYFFRICLFSTLLPALLMVNRAVIMYCFFGAALIYLMSRKDLCKSLAKISVIGVFIVFLFGLIGNMRTSNNDNSEVILTLGKATDSFKNSIFPTEFFWTYLYIASPLSNLQSTVNDNESPSIVYSESDVFSLVVNCLTPQIISKRLDVPKKAISREIDVFNVGTVYAQPFATLGWLGVSIVYFFTLVFIFFNLSFVSLRSDYFVTSLTIINTIIFFNIFENMFVFMGLVPQLLIPIILSLRNKYSFRLNLKK